MSCTSVLKSPFSALKKSKRPEKKRSFKSSKTAHTRWPGDKRAALRFFLNPFLFLFFLSCVCVCMETPSSAQLSESQKPLCLHQQETMRDSVKKITTTKKGQLRERLLHKATHSCTTTLSLASFFFFCCVCVCSCCLPRRCRS